MGKDRLPFLPGFWAFISKITAQAIWIGVLLNLQCWDSLMSIKSYFPMTLWDQKWQFQFNDRVVNFQKSLTILKNLVPCPKGVQHSMNHFCIFWPKAALSSLWLMDSFQSEGGFCWPEKNSSVGWWLAVKQKSKGILGIKEFWQHFISDAFKVPFIIIFFS